MGRYHNTYLIPIVTVAFFGLIGCGDAPKEETKAKEPVKPSAPITGRQGFQMTYASARAWEADATPIRVRSMDLESVKGDAGLAPFWEVTYVSQSRNRIRIFTWSASDEGSLHKGVYGTADDVWAGPTGQERPFASIAIETDTPAALKTAVEASDTYLKKPGHKPAISYLLQFTPRYPDPVWLVFWGTSAGAAEHTVTVDATTGQLLAHD